jgi:hypothetical protein
VSICVRLLGLLELSILRQWLFLVAFRVLLVLQFVSVFPQQDELFLMQFPFLSVFGPTINEPFRFLSVILCVFRLITSSATEILVLRVTVLLFDF